MIIEILGAACLGTLAADIFTHFNLPSKPFQCDACMAFWISIVPNILLHGYEGLMMSGISAILANLIFKIGDRL